MIKVTLRSLAEKWPSDIVARTEVKAFTGGTISEKYMANLDCQGAGPEGRFKVGRKVAYPVASLIKWLENRSQVVE